MSNFANEMQSGEVQFKHAAFDFEVKESGDTRTIKGYGSIFGNVDSHSDVVAPGAFKQSISSIKPKMLWQHDYRIIPGVWDVVREDSKGLYLEGRFIDTQAGKDAYIAAKEKAIEGMSIGYITKDYAYDSDKKIRTLKEVKLLEVSLVTFPSNENAKILTVKSVPQNERELEDFLRDAGYSRSIAKGIVKLGAKALSDLRDVDVEESGKVNQDKLDEIKTLLTNLSATMKKDSRHELGRTQEVDRGDQY